MLHVITAVTDPLLTLIKDDPVRPELDLDFRVNDHAEVFVLLDSDPEGVMPRATAVVCCAYRANIPSTVEELKITPAVSPTAAVFYTIWSYHPGAGRKLIMAARSWIQEHRSHIRDFVTLSPPTEMARIFHIRNGATVMRVNSETVNYLYP
jgi:hypothetical protein